MKKNKIIFNILTVIAYFYGLFLIATLILIPVGIYAIISAHRYSYFADLTPASLAMRKKQVTSWIIFGAVLYFPIGLIGLFCLNSVSNNITVSDVQEPESETNSTANSSNSATEVSIDNPITEAEKAEKLEKLKRFKDNGLITPEEYEQAVSQIKNTNE